MMGHVVCQFVSQYCCEPIFVLADRQDTAEDKYFSPGYEFCVSAATLSFVMPSPGVNGTHYFDPRTAHSHAGQWGKNS